MKRPDTFTITTFWIDWLFLLPLLGLGLLTFLWGLADLNQATQLIPEGAIIITWAIAFPLFASAVGCVIIGLGMLIKEEYWEFRALCTGLVLWALSCCIGAILIFVGFFQGDTGLAAILNFVGIVIVAIIIIYPALTNPSSPSKVLFYGRIWSVLLIFGVGALTVGLLIGGFPYYFPRLPLAIGALHALGIGLYEVAFRKSGFSLLPRLWKPDLGQEFRGLFDESFNESNAWRIEGLVKVLTGISGLVILILISIS